jgi:hypothetical protein
MQADATGKRQRRRLSHREEGEEECQNAKQSLHAGLLDASAILTAAAEKQITVHGFLPAMVYRGADWLGGLMKLRWYINRLRNMEPAEVLHRLAEHRRRAASRGRDEGWVRYAAKPVGAVFPGLAARVTAANEAQRRAIALAAEATLAGRFSALGRDWPQRGPASLFPPDLWRLDPVTGRLWPGADVYTFDIDFRHDGSRGDIKYVWEINRLQFLPALAAHMLLEDDVRSLAAIEAAIESWHRANPPFRGVAWSSGIEVALRAISLIVTCDLLGDRISDDARRRAGEILVASGYWLPRFPSRFSSANNHLVAELAGEFLIGLALAVPATPARETLQAEVLKQILPDGTGAEQSPTYAAFTAELVLLCALAARGAGQPFAPPVEQRLGAFADFVGRFVGESVSFGDDDEGRAMTLGNEPDYPASVAAAIAGFRDQRGVLPRSGDFRTLLFGAPAAAISADIGLTTFPDGGLSVWRGEIQGRRVHLTFDHGPLGYLSIAAHGHADALALTLSIDGVPVLVDPGTWLYGSGGSWRSWFRSTPAHNTLNIEGVSQSTMAGAFNWSHKADAELIESRPEPDWRLRGRHHGYRKRYGVTHERTLSRETAGISVTDRLAGGAREAEIVFQLAAGLAAERTDNRVTVRRNGEPLLEMHFPDPAIEISSGGDMPGQGGWVSPRFGIRQPAERVSWRGKVDENGVRSWLLPIQGRG